MYIKSLCLKNFRNFSGSVIDFSEGINVLYGDNAQGKTNIIEAVWLFSSCKSFRTNNERELINNDSQSASSLGVFARNGREYKAEFRLNREKRREIYLNGIKVKPKEIIGKFTSIMFYPELLGLIKNGPDERRRFLDFSICQLKPAFYDILQEYTRVLLQRNRLLKNDMQTELYTLDIWDQKLAGLSAAISETRMQYLQKLDGFTKKIHSEISAGKEELSLEYITKNKSYSEEEVLSLLRRERERDLRLGYTSVGCHKDDFGVDINGKSARIFGSQGQQRSCVMSLKLAEAEIINRVYGEYPLILLDDVLSELDETRREFIIEKITGKQVIITTCEKIDFSLNSHAIKVEKGSVV